MEQIQWKGLQHFRAQSTNDTKAKRDEAAVLSVGQTDSRDCSDLSIQTLFQHSQHQERNQGTAVEGERWVSPVLRDSEHVSKSFYQACIFNTIPSPPDAHVFIATIHPVHFPRASPSHQASAQRGTWVTWMLSRLRLRGLPLPNAVPLHKCRC